jgi:hypothetical protein
MWDQDGYSDELLKQGVALVENPKFQCTSLRDFLVNRIILCLVPGAKEQKRSRLWEIISVIGIVGAFILIGWWGLAVLGLVACLEYQRSRSNTRLRETTQEINQVYSEVRRGGYDEHVIIRRLESLEKRNIAFPSVLYALLRLPRRNAEAEITKEFKSLELEKKKAIWQQWKVFLDFILKNDDGKAAREERNAPESRRAEIFEPIRKGLASINLQTISRMTPV